jgi:hypothetical protein
MDGFVGDVGEGIVPATPVCNHWPWPDVPVLTTVTDGCVGTAASPALATARLRYCLQAR